MLSSREKIFLARSAEFQKLLTEDSFLNGIDRSADTLAEELQSLQVLAGGPRQIGKLKLRPLTAGVWSFLWCIQNSYASDLRNITEADTDCFLYLLCHNALPVLRDGEKKVLSASENWCRKFEIDYPECAGALMQIVHDAFTPLSLLPPSTGGGEPDWGCAWLTQYGCTAARESGQSVEYCMFEMPLLLGLYCVINNFRKQDSRGLIYKRTAKEKAELIGEYIEKLGRSFIDRQGGIPSP